MLRDVVAVAMLTSVHAARIAAQHRAAIQYLSETEEEAAERKKHPFTEAPERMTISPVAHEVPVATPLYITVTMAPGKLVSKNLLSTLYVQQIGPRGEGVPNGSGPAKVVEVRGLTKVIKVTPVQLGQVTFRLSSLYSDNAYVTQDIQVHVYPVSKGLTHFALGLPAVYNGIVEGDPGGEPIRLVPELRYDGVGTIYPGDLSAIRLSIEQSAGDPVIHVDDKGMLHFLRIGKATLIGDVAGVKCVIGITVYTNAMYPTRRR